MDKLDALAKETGTAIDKEKSDMWERKAEIAIGAIEKIVACNETLPHIRINYIKEVIGVYERI